jgi:thiol-disulfide isomerase/thioredoxin
MVNISSTIIVNALLATSTVSAFTSPFVKSPRQVAFARKVDTSLNAEDKLAKDVTGAELEVMLTEWDQPLVLDAYATWCGPCLLVSLFDMHRALHVVHNLSILLVYSPNNVP